MPPRQPLSPLSFETCAQPSDAESDAIVASDDELDEASRESRRRRIESLADTYRRGAPLYILSASLQGPFDKGWVNPWRKNRRRKASSERKVGFKEADSAQNRIVQETDPERRRQSRHAKSPIAPAEPGPASSARSQRSTLPEDERSRGSRPSSGRLKAPTPSGKESQAHGSSPVYRQNNDHWLKGDRNYLRLTQVDTPSSPTSSLSARHLDAKPSKRRSMGGPSRHSASRGSATTDQRQTEGTPVKRVTSRSESSTDNQTPHGSRASVSHAASPAVSGQAVNPEASLCIASSGSHLPKFEYRRRKKSSSKKRRSSSKKDISAPECEKTEQATSLVGDLKPSDERPAPRPVESEANHFTETGERLPSAQRMPKDPGVTDYEPSLHSTALPKRSPNVDASPDAQLSTQAALLHAQQSFQNDLDTPERTTQEKRPASQSPSRSQPPPGSVTPFYRLNTPNPNANDPSNGDRVEGPQMMSTQYMIDAATPFTVGTGKKNKRSGASKSKSSNKKRKKASFAVSLSPSNDRPSHENASASEHPSAEAGTRPQDIQHQSANNQSESQLSALPFTLSGSTPPTAQDGQGNEPADSFDLSQAIAEAGSWLQQSFDLNVDMREVNKTGRSSSAVDVDSAIH